MIETELHAEGQDAVNQTTLHAGPEQQGDSTQVPQRPALAANVELVGEMQGTGFKDQQWLIQRGGQFIQVAELLYRVAEQANGEHTLAEIADGVTEATEWMVSTDNVRQLIQSKLIPLGLIAGAGDSSIPSGMTAGGSRSSPLAVNMRMKMIGPNVLKPITGALQVLFARPILIPMLVAIIVAHLWVYLFNLRGVVGGVVEVLYKPGLLLAALVIVTVAAIFHEFGHAAALRYGGGHVRGMGAGLYLIYPAFYTDVTDSYRLGRWARVRTDLGGVYFHLIFALGLVGLYILTGEQFLLFSVVLISTEVARQFIPFVRLDGYWVLADLTGIPDFFSQIGPFVRSVLPIRGMSGSKLPELEGWVKAVFAIFIILTVPVLLILLVLMVVSLPALLATTWDSFLAQAEQLAQAQNHGNILIMLLPLAQMLMLALPVLGTAYLLYSLVRPTVTALWKWSSPQALAAWPHRWLPLAPLRLWASSGLPR